MILRPRSIVILCLLHFASLLPAQERTFTVLLLPPKPITQTEDTLAYLPLLYRSIEVTPDLTEVRTGS